MMQTKEVIIAPRTKQKVNYSCPGGHLNVWGKPDLKLLCYEGNPILAEL